MITLILIPVELVVVLWFAHRIRRAWKRAHTWHVVTQTERNWYTTTAPEKKWTAIVVYIDRAGYEPIRIKGINPHDDDWADELAIALAAAEETCSILRASKLTR
jgi:hypothetical protein